MTPLRPLSVLDLSPVTTGNSGPQALRNSIDLARLADRLGFTRYWVAEHHNMPNIASSAPDIMIGQIAAATEHLRVGSGRRDAAEPCAAAGRRALQGAGRPVSRPHRSRPRPRAGHRSGDLLRAAAAAGRSRRRRFPRPLPGAAGVRAGRLFPESHPFRKVNAMPADVPLPPLYLLGSSGYSAQLAAHVGAGFSFAHHFSDFDPVGPMIDLSRAVQAVGDAATSRSPSSRVHVVCADTDAEAERLATSVDLNFALRRQGTLPADPEPGGSRGAQLFADRPRADRAEPRPTRGRQQGQGDGASRTADQSDAGRRGDGHDHDLRSRGAQSTPTRCWPRRSD